MTEHNREELECLVNELQEDISFLNGCISDYESMMKNQSFDRDIMMNELMKDVEEKDIKTKMVTDLKLVLQRAKRL